MLGLIGVILSLALLIFFAYRGINVLILAPLCALFATIFASGPLLATYTQVFMPALGGYVIMIALLTQWHRQDSKESNRFDRHVDAGTDDSYGAYNQMLAQLAERDRQG